jgi:hypothetical protein
MAIGKSGKKVFDPFNEKIKMLLKSSDKKTVALAQRAIDGDEEARKKCKKLIKASKAESASDMIDSVLEGNNIQDIVNNI